MGWFRRNAIGAPVIEPALEERAITMSLNDPAIAELLGFGSGGGVTGITVTEQSALSLSAVYRSALIIASTMAALPHKSYRTLADGSRQEVPSVFDTMVLAGVDDVTAYELLETMYLHLALHGNAFLYKIRNAAGAVIAFKTIHPLAVSVELRNGEKVFSLQLEGGGTADLTSYDVLHIPGPTMDGIVGLSPITVARNSMGISLAGERAAGKMFSQGAMIAGMVSPESEEDLTAEDATAIKQSLNSGVLGYENAGTIAVINRVLKFTPWAMSAKDSQFLESRQWQVIEVARWFGIPTTLLMENEKNTSWGTGIQEMNLAFARYTLFPYARRIEGRFSALLANPRFVEISFEGLLKPNPEEEIQLLLAQLNGGAISLNEMRSIKNLPPVPGGEEIRVPSGIQLLSALQTAPSDLAPPAVESDGAINTEEVPDGPAQSTDRGTESAAA